MERSLSFIPLIVVAPFINIMAYVIIGFQCGWLYSGITCAIWIVIVICQHFTAKQGGILKAKESASNDARQKLVQDMINGAHTIKCYGWEQHYIDNMKKLRRNQIPYIVAFQFVQFMGISIYQNGGLLVIIAITVGLW